MKNPFDFFERIVLINLDSRSDRLHKSLEQWENYGISTPITRFPAIKLQYQDGSDDKFSSRCGCSLSHFEVCRLAKLNNWCNYLVLEDDFEFNLNPAETFDALNGVLQELPYDWDMLYLGGNLTDQYGMPPIQKFSKHLFRLYSCHTTHAMALNSTFYDAFLDKAPDIQSISEWTKTHEIIDVHLSRHILPKRNCFISTKLLMLQSAGFSDIEKHSFDYRDWLRSSFEIFKNKA